MIRPLLSNIFLHHVLDYGFVEVAQPRLSKYWLTLHVNTTQKVDIRPVDRRGNNTL